MEDFKNVPDFDKFVKETYKSSEETAPQLDESIEDIVDESTEEQIEEAAKLAFLNDKLIKEKIAKSGLLALLGDNNKPLNTDKNKFIQALSKSLLGLYKTHSSLPVK